MPELPEVETVRRVLDERYRGKRIDSVTVGQPTFYRKPPASAIRALSGSVISGFNRRGKYLLINLEGQESVVFHLGMSGRLTVGGESPHVRFELAIGHDRLRFHDSRRFGRVGCTLPPLGPEPMDAQFTADFLKSVLSQRQAPIKAILMDQKLIAGLGNIYATEALHLAGIRPDRRARSLTRPQIDRLTKSCRHVLELGITLGGSTLDDESFLDPMGLPGQMQKHVKIYGRTRCASCGSQLKATRKKISGRTSLYCPSCQA